MLFRTCAAFLALSSLVAPLAAQTNPLPDPDSVRLDRLQLMQGFPAPANRQVTAANHRKYPNMRWAFHHMREMFPTRNIARGAGPVSPLPAGPDLRQRIDAIRFTGANGKEQTFADYLKTSYADATLVMKDGKVVYETYMEGMPAQNPHLMFSVTKSVVGLIASQLIDEGALRADRLVTEYLPELKDSGWKGATVQQVLNMTADVDYTEIYDTNRSGVAQYIKVIGLEPVAADEQGPRDLYSYLPKIGAAGAHGERFIYRTVHTEVLGWILQRATGEHLADLISKRLWQPMGSEYDAHMLVDPHGAEWAGIGLNATLRDLGRLGELMRNEGRVDGKQIISANVVREIRRGGDREAFKASGNADRQGYSYRNQWWISHNSDGTYEALGVRGQMIHVNPTAGLVVVRLSSHPLADSSTTYPVTARAMAALASALR
ncbi:MAG: serine hydrolase [Rubrivivax sp.]